MVCVQRRRAAQVRGLSISDGTSLCKSASQLVQAAFSLWVWLIDCRGETQWAQIFRRGSMISAKNVRPVWLWCLGNLEIGRRAASHRMVCGLSRSDGTLSCNSQLARLL